MIFEITIILFILLLIGTLANWHHYHKNNAYDKMSFKESMDLTELPVVTFYNKDKKLNFLLDTGSNLCVINKQNLKGLEYKELPNTTSLFGMEGKAVKVTFISMSFNYKDNNYTTDFQVVDMQNAFNEIKRKSGVTIHGILGSKFFEEFKYILDYKELTAYSKK